MLLGLLAVQYILGVDVDDGLNNLSRKVTNFLLAQLPLGLQPLLQILNRLRLTPSEQYSMKMYWKFSSSNQ